MPTGIENASMSEKIEVRGATASDGEAICTIYNAAIQERGSTFETTPRAAEDFEARIDNERFPLLVSTGSGKVIGWAGLAPYSDANATRASGRRASMWMLRCVAAESARSLPKRSPPPLGAAAFTR
jgi:hypothetical protein